MKQKKVLVTLAGLLALVGTTLAAAQEKAKNEPPADSKALIRTYELKNANPRDILSVIMPYMHQAAPSYNSDSRILVVKVLPENLQAFEDLLKKLDAQQPQIAFRVFTLVASPKTGAPALEQPELAGVVENLRRVLGFKSYTLDGVSALTVQSGSRNNAVELNSRISNLYLDLAHVVVDAGAAGKRQVSLGLDLYRKDALGPAGKDQVFANHYLLRSEQTVIAENGTLVAGVSKLGEGGDALVLVIQATIQ